MTIESFVKEIREFQTPGSDEHALFNAAADEIERLTAQQQGGDHGTD